MSHDMNIQNKCPWCNHKVKDTQYWPYCSYHCQEKGKLRQAQLYVARMRAREENHED